MKRWICGLLGFLMILSLIPGQAFAAVTEESSFLLVEQRETEMILRQSSGTLSTGPALAEGNHEKWIDRIADLPEFAAEFYTWLEDNASASGALADPSAGEVLEGMYVHTLDAVEGSANFTYTSSDNKLELAKQASINAIGNLPDIMMAYAFATYGAFDRDHPEVFWLDGGSICGYGIEYGYSTFPGSGFATANYTLYVYFYLQSPDFDIRAADYRNTSLIASAIEQRDSNVDRILGDRPTDSGAAEQIRYLNQMLTETNAYNSAVAENNAAAASNDAWECVSALAGSSGATGPVCEGYARAFKVLCDELSIPCVLVEGNAKFSTDTTTGPHMWNYVQLEGSWYAVDITWNDPYVFSDPESVNSGYEGEQWLLLGGDTLVDTDLTFIQSHPVENAVFVGGLGFVNGPVLSGEKYTEEEVPEEDNTEEGGSEAENLLDVAPYRNGDVFTAPVMEGKVFAGWYTDEALTQPLGRDVTTGKAYAKFMDANILTLKWQVSNGTTADSASTNLRMLTSVDSLQYNHVFFHINIGGKISTLSSSKAYRAIVAGTTVIRNPSAVFSSESAYFMTYTLTGVPNAYFNTDISITPGWETLDGTEVTGISRTFQISEAY